MKNSEIYAKEPVQNRLLNQGVAEVAEDYSTPALSVLRYELETFICEGQYRKGLEKILNSYLGNLGKAEQQGVWISGFYGSGKSHLVKMLRILWTDYAFPDGATARKLPDLPDSVGTALKEISTAAKRNGRLFAAAGKMGSSAGSSVRLALLGILFKAEGFPEQYAQARFLLWLRQNGNLDFFKKHMKTAKRDLYQELNNLYVSPHIAKALREIDPSYKDDKDVRDTLKTQFRQPEDIGDGEMVKTMEALLDDGNGVFPLSLVILDELQQYIGADQERAYQVQLVTETCCKRFGGRLLFVATGQSALSDMPNLQKMMGRFPLSVQLSDADVETVIRRIILAKKPTAEQKLAEGLESWSGEISRHLQGTPIAHTKRDDKVLSSDYPLLPTRRRFWERALRTMDTTGTIAQLRNQLLIVDEAVYATADKPLGTVVAGDFVFDQISGSLASSGQLSLEMYNTIQKMDGASDAASKLKARIMKLVFLINKLPEEAGSGKGIFAVPDVISDFLVEDLSRDTADLRRRVPEALKDLAKDGVLMCLDGAAGMEYRLQTRESKEWHDEYRRQESGLRGSTKTVEIKHAELVKERIMEGKREFQIQQGHAKEAREPALCFSDQLPAGYKEDLHLWVRDGWRTTEASALADARALKNDDPTVIVFLSDEYRNEIYGALLSREAAAATLQIKGIPATREGEEARHAIESRLANAEALIADRMGKVIESAKVWLAGGGKVPGMFFTDQVRTAVEKAVSRLYPKFDVADSAGWARVYEKARKNDKDCLQAAGYAGDAAKNPVCAEILSYVGPAGKTGGDVRSNFGASPYGWPRDAIDGALYALLAHELLKATDPAKPGAANDAKNLERSKVSSVRFAREDAPLLPDQRIRIRKLYQGAGIPSKAGEESARAGEFLQALRAKAQAAGGDAPLPARPGCALLDEIGGLIGNQQLQKIHDESERLAKWISEWDEAAKKGAARLQLWNTLGSLLDHTRGLPDAEDVEKDAKAILEKRMLLSDPDPVRPLVDKASSVLRKELGSRVSRYETVYRECLDGLKKDDSWKKIPAADRTRILRSVGALEPEKSDLSGAKEVLERLEEAGLAEREDRIGMLPSRFEKAREEAARRLEPKAVQVDLPHGVIRNEAEAKKWLSEAEAAIKEQLKKGPVSV